MEFEIIYRQLALSRNQPNDLNIRDMKKSLRVPKRVRKTFIRQKDQTDCGVVCLGMVIRYFDGEERLERLREWSGTNQKGTTLLGLYQAAGKVGLEARAYTIEPDNLQDLRFPCILHTLKDRRLQHYVVCYGYEQGRFLVSDPGSGIKSWSVADLEAVWPTRSALVLEPTDRFQKRRAVRRDKWTWVLHLVREDLNILGLALAIGAGIALLSISTAVFSQKLIDEILPNRDRIKLVLGGVLLAFLLFSKNGLSYIRQRFLIDQRKEFNTRVIRHFFGSLVYLPQPFFFTRKIGDLIARMNDTHRLQSAVAFVIGDMMIDVLLVITATTFIFSYNVPLGLLALGSLPLFFLLTVRYHSPIFQHQRAVMAAHSANESNYVDTIRGMSAIKTQNKESQVAAHTHGVYSVYQERIQRLGHIGARFNFWAEMAGTALLIGFLTWSALMVLGGTLRLGVLVAMLQMVHLLIPSAMSLALTNLRLQEARVAFDRMYEFTSLDPEYEREAVNRHHLGQFRSLSVNGLTFRFPGRRALLQDISFHIDHGEFVALLGESGCGKTTLLQILQRFYEPESGDLILNGSLPWKIVSTAGWRQLLGVVPQHINIFNGTLLENIALGASSDDFEGITRKCEEYGLDRFFTRFPQGYATLLGEQGANISGGQRQLVAFARALSQNPQLLLLDEATTDMDRNTEKWILNLVTQLKARMGVLMVTHQAPCAKYADRILVIENGRLSCQGSPEELMQEENLFSQSFLDHLFEERSSCEYEQIRVNETNRHLENHQD